MSAPAKKPVAKPKASLIAAASKPKAPAAAAPAPVEPASAPSAGPSTGLQRTATAVSSGSGSNSARSTPTVQDGPVAPVARMKFKPKVPVKKAGAVPDVKPEIVEPAAFSRGGMRGGQGARGGAGGRGGRGGRRGAAQPSVPIAAGIFGGPRNLPSTRGGGSFAPRAAYDDVADLYSDDEDEETGSSAASDVYMGAVSGLGESSPMLIPLRTRPGVEVDRLRESLLEFELAEDAGEDAEGEEADTGQERELFGTILDPRIPPDDLLASNPAAALYCNRCRLNLILSSPLCHLCGQGDAVENLSGLIELRRHRARGEQRMMAEAAAAAAEEAEWETCSSGPSSNSTGSNATLVD